MNTRTAFRICPLCEAGCGLAITISGNRVEKIRGDEQNPMSKGFCCPKGIALKDLHEDPDRLRQPMIREDGKFRPASWGEALARVEEKLTAVRQAGGNDAVAVYLGNPNTHTMAGGVFIRPLIKAFKTKNFYTASTVDQMPKMAACGFLYGSPMRIPIPDIDRTDLFVVFGANPFVSNGSLMTAPDMPGRIRALKKRGGKLIVIDPIRTRTAEAADRHLFIRPGADVYLLLALVNVLFSESLVKTGHIDAFIDDAELLRQAVKPFTPEKAAAFCGIAPDQIAALARQIARANTCAVYGRMGTSTVKYGTVSSWLIEVINILTGNLDREGGTMFVRPAHLPDGSIPRKGYAVGRFTSRVSGAPEVSGELPVAVMPEEMETEGEGRIRALLTVAGNPVVATPQSDRLDAALAGLDFMVSVDYYINESTRHAHVILPPASILCHGHYDFFFHALSVHNYACYSPPVFERALDEKDKWEILAHLALIAGGRGAAASPSELEAQMVDELAAGVIKAMGGEKSGVTKEMLTTPLSGSRGPERILDFLLRIGPYGDNFGMKPDGINLEKLIKNPHGIDLGPLKSWIKHALANPDGKIHLFPEAMKADIEALTQSIGAAAGPERGRMVLVGRRHLRTNNSWMHNIESLVSKNPCTLLVHPDDAKRLGLADNVPAQITSSVGSIAAAVEITSDIMPGVVSLPHGWGHDVDGIQMDVARQHPGVNTNRITPAETDRITGTAVLNGIPVTIAPAV